MQPVRAMEILAESGSRHALRWLRHCLLESLRFRLNEKLCRLRTIRLRLLLLLLLFLRSVCSWMRCLLLQLLRWLLSRQSRRLTFERLTLAGRNTRRLLLRGSSCSRS